jgi:hypothetical protein
MTRSRLRDVLEYRGKLDNVTQITAKVGSAIYQLKVLFGSCNMWQHLKGS